jgi:hypothetical protein
MQLSEAFVQMQEPPKDRKLSKTKREVLTSLGTWGVFVTAASASGLLAKLPARLVAPLIIGGIALPTIAYAEIVNVYGPFAIDI